ncbi:MAG: hypothetical protein H8E14_16850 [Candidatus Marinimicrobia bacterium]|nr:hypothetical protein [Candidatus Neomarinimicrobiota bacterium]
MKVAGYTTIILVLLFSFVFAGGIVTNTNQSADFTRTLNRNASTDLDAVFFNPAGLSKLDDGFHLYLSNQTISQGREITSDVSFLNAEKFEGTTFAPVFPNFYLAYKMNRLTFAAGFTPIGGGGSAEFPDGLPSFEVPASVIPASLVAGGIPTTSYSLDVEFNGSSIYMGGQASVTFKINDMISVAAGARYFSAMNTYEGHLKDIMVDPTYPDLGFDGSMTSAPAFFTTMQGALTAGAAQATAGATSATGGAAGLQPLIDLGAGGTSFDNLVLGGYMTQAQIDEVGAGLTALGFTWDSSVYTPNTAQASFSGAAASLTTMAADLTTQAGEMAYNAAATADIEVDAEQTGTAFAPIFGLYVSPMENLGIGIRYEAMAALELENSTKVDGSGLFPDGAKTNADMPAMLGVGVAYKVMPSLRLEFDYNLYFNEAVDWDGKEDHVENGTEIGFAAEFALSNALTLSGGYLISTSGAKDTYHTDLSYSLNSSTLGFGAKYALNPTTALSVGFSNTMYEEGSKTGVDYRGLITGKETYLKTAVVFAFGIQKSF